MPCGFAHVAYVHSDMPWHAVRVRPYPSVSLRPSPSVCLRPSVSVRQSMDQRGRSAQPRRHMGGTPWASPHRLRESARYGQVCARPRSRSDSTSDCVRVIPVIQEDSVEGQTLVRRLSIRVLVRHTPRAPAHYPPTTHTPGTEARHAKEILYATVGVRHRIPSATPPSPALRLKNNGPKIISPYLYRGRKIRQNPSVVRPSHRQMRQAALCLSIGSGRSSFFGHVIYGQYYGRVAAEANF